MDSWRILGAAVATVLLMVPALATADQVGAGPIEETIVEGHTVYAVLENVETEEGERQAAAVAVLVREREVRESRFPGFPGVLWFNDQYLVPPGGPEGADGAADTRYPCGGAVLAVNHGDPDPRQVMLNLQGAETRPDEDAWVEVDVSRQGGPAVRSSAATALEYVESYLVTDPNDHSWIVDKYEATTLTQAQLTRPLVTTERTTYPIWVVNALGSPTFIPDNNHASCPAHVDDPWQQAALNAGYRTGDRQACSTKAFCPSRDDPDANHDGIPDGGDTESPSLGYREPTPGRDTDGDGHSDTSYCYSGQSADAGRGASDDAYGENGRGCDHDRTYLPPTGDDWGRDTDHPLRLYNAVLFFFLGPEDVRVIGNGPHGARDTNGCQAGTEWHCPTWQDGAGDADRYGDAPGHEDDDMEGNSHPFNPTGVWVPAVPDGTPGGRVEGTGEQYDVANRTGGMHTEHDRGLVDLYFSAEARPLEPPVREFVVTDTHGRTAPFHDHRDSPSTP